MERQRDDDHGGTQRPKYRDNDDHRDTLSGDERLGTKPDTRTEATGEAREQVGDNTRGTDAEPTGPEGNDRTKLRPRPDTFGADLRDSDRKNNNLG
jgi:hypothetical protein